MRKFNETTLEEIMLAINQGTTIADVLRILNCHDNTSNRDKLKTIITSNNIDIAHLKQRTVKQTYLDNPKYCKHCGNIIPFEKRDNQFCNASCAASFNNLHKTIKKVYCLNCGKEINSRNKFCNNTCYSEYKRKQYIECWKKGEETGTVGEDDIATAIRYYLFEKYNNSCELCGWTKVNPYTGLVPLQIHHIDGDCKNNSEENLQLLCPNCHALTSNFGSRNDNCTRIDKRFR